MIAPPTDHVVDFSSAGGNVPKGGGLHYNCREIFEKLTLLWNRIGATQNRVRPVQAELQQVEIPATGQKWDEIRLSDIVDTIAILTTDLLTKMEVLEKSI